MDRQHQQEIVNILFTKTIKNRMTKNSALIVPLEIDIGHGNNWDEAH